MASTHAEKITQELAPGEFLFTSESVNEGHPDKLCDIVSDAVLDACLEVCTGDQHPLVACETAAKDNMVMVFGEITLPKGAKVNYEEVARAAVKKIGYDDASTSIDWRTCEVLNKIAQQSPDIAQGVHGEKAHEGEHDTLKAGDQGIMFGYATDETQSKMPLSHVLATRLGAKLTQVRKSKQLAWVRPDGKTQVTVVYKNVNGRMVPVRVHTIVISTMHTETYLNEAGEQATLSHDVIESQLKEFVINPVLAEAEKDINAARELTGDAPITLLNDDIIYFLNPSGRFVIGGPLGDAGLTGRKIIIDTYGGWGAHGGGAFSGKDPSKVDRSAAYAARWIAKSLVNTYQHNGESTQLASRVLVQLSYAIGVEHPLSVHVDSYGTVKKGLTDEDLAKIVSKSFDLTPQGIINELKLNRPIYSYTSVYGHFGRTDAAYLEEKGETAKTPIDDWAQWEEPLAFDKWVGLNEALKN